MIRCVHGSQTSICDTKAVVQKMLWLVVTTTNEHKMSRLRPCWILFHCKMNSSNIVHLLIGSQIMKSSSFNQILTKSPALRGWRCGMRQWKTHLTPARFTHALSPWTFTVYPGWIVCRKTWMLPFFSPACPKYQGGHIIFIVKTVSHRGCFKTAVCKSLRKHLPALYLVPPYVLELLRTLKRLVEWAEIGWKRRTSCFQGVPFLYKQIFSFSLVCWLVPL